MQVVDLRAARRRPSWQVEVRASPATELVLVTAALADGGCTDFDVPDERFIELRGRLEDELLEQLDTESGKIWLALTNLPEAVDEHDAEGLLAAIDDDPTIAWRTVMTSPLHSFPSFDPSVIDRYLDGEIDAGEVTNHLDALGVDEGGLCHQLATEPPAAFGRRIAAILRQVHDTVGAEMLAEAAGPISREAEARTAQVADGTPVHEVVLQATNGFELTDDMPVSTVVLLPSYWFRPWIIVGRVGDREVITTPVADEHLALPSQAPPPSLVKLTKALADDGRLRLLRRMGGGAIALSEAMAELDVAKTTAHHHLSILRQAGLVVIRGEGRDTTYALRVDAPAAVRDALAEYLGEHPGAMSAASSS